MFQWHLSEHSNVTTEEGVLTVMEVANTKTNNLQIPQNLQNRLNVLDGFHVLYPSVIVTHCVRQIINRVTSSEMRLSAWIPQYYCRDKEATTSHTRDSLMDFNACRPAYSPITLWHVNVLGGWKQINEQRHGVCLGLHEGNMKDTAGV